MNRVLIKTQDLLSRRLLARKASRGFTGELEDLRRLLDFGGAKAGLDENPGLQAFFTGLRHDIEDNMGMAALFVRVGKAVNATGKRKLVKNLIYNWGVQGKSDSSPADHPRNLDP